LEASDPNNLFIKPILFFVLGRKDI
jgi:hypothetical protein